MAMLTVDVPDDIADEFNRTFANHDKDAIMVMLLTHLFDSVKRQPEKTQALIGNLELPPSLVSRMLEARLEVPMTQRRLSPDPIMAELIEARRQLREETGGTLDGLVKYLRKKS